MVAARELRREGHCPTVFEQGDQIGGVWVYTDEIEAEDPLGVPLYTAAKLHLTISG